MIKNKCIGQVSIEMRLISEEVGRKIEDLVKKYKIKDEKLAVILTSHIASQVKGLCSLFKDEGLAALVKVAIIRDISQEYIEKVAE